MRVHAHLVLTSEAGVFGILKNLKQLGLKVRSHFADCVQQQRAFAGKLKFSGLIVQRAGECSTFVTEELGFEQFVRQRSAIHFQERFVVAGRIHVDESG